MKVTAYLSELKVKHAKLDEKIKQEMRSPLPDTLRISNLKKQKLHLKEQIIQTKTA